jgi:nucleoside-triphosphatase
MHIFLTGEIQIGKSTVVEKTLALLKRPYGGFRTYFGPDRYAPDHCLYMGGAALPKAFGEENVVVRFQEGVPEAYAERFDTLGARYISEAQAHAKLLVMDECGRLERQAKLFQRRVLDALDGDIPILGVVKLAADGWVDNIRTHPRIKLITVDAQNRDRLPEELIGMLTG